MSVCMLLLGGIESHWKLGKTMAEIFKLQQNMQSNLCH